MIHRIGELDASKHRLIYWKVISRLRIGVMFAVNIIRVYSLSLSLVRSSCSLFFVLKGYLEEYQLLKQLNLFEIEVE